MFGNFQIFLFGISTFFSPTFHIVCNSIHPVSFEEFSQLCGMKVESESNVFVVDW